VADRRPLLLFSLVLAGAFAFSLGLRANQYRDWLANPEAHFSNGVAVSSTDAYRWFRFAARELRGEAPLVGRDPLRGYPDGVPNSEPSLLARGMAALAASADLDVYRAGMLLMIPLSSLFLIPLGFFFYRERQPAAGLLGGLIGSTSSIYMVRSHVYRVDTDGGNLFFVWLIALCIAGTATATRRGPRLAMAALSGLCIQAFCAWYAQPGFAVVYAACLLLQLWMCRLPAREIAGLLAVALLLADPRNLASGSVDLVHFAARYVLGGAGVAQQGLVFPSLLSEIGELQRLDLRVALGTLLDPPVLAALGLIAFALFAVRHWRRVIPLLPILILGALGLLRSSRFLMYLAPCVGIGYGCWLAALLQRLGRRRSGAVAHAVTASHAALPLRVVALECGAALLVFALLLPHTGYSLQPQPRIGVDLIASLQALAARLPKHAVIAHSWGHGYLVTAVTGAATLNDGELLDPVVEQLLDRGLVSSDPAELHEILGFLAARGRSGVDALLAESPDYAALLAQMREAQAAPRDPLVLLLTDKMAHEFSQTFRKGYWDFAGARGPRAGYDFRRCRGEVAQQLLCEKPEHRPLRVDLARGTLHGVPIVARLLRIRAGAVVEEREYPASPGVVLQLVEGAPGEPSELQILSQGVFETNFNQMFMLGRYDAGRFRRIHDDFPVARAYTWLGPAATLR
jgi:asparagine N-glycosylation enzyme membrane subunit Stt3